HHRGGAERIDIGLRKVGLQDHVGLVDRLPAFDRRTVEHQAVFQRIFVHHAGAHLQVLPLALGIGEAQVDPFDLLILDLLHDIFCTGHWFHSSEQIGWFLMCLPGAAVPVPVGVLPPAASFKRSCELAASSRSPVRMRNTVSMVDTKILPSPMRPVCAAAAIASTTRSAWSSDTTTSSFTLGRKSTTYSAPRYSSVWPFWRPKPLASVTVMPDTPTSCSASFTSSSLNGLMMASIFFTGPLQAKPAPPPCSRAWAGRSDFIPASILQESCQGVTREA